ncbi:hypothetical protein BUALT_Bualt07G0152700 [Buddleja alternifolia]|uniref:Uncharacterized protein n=1 Tax=Buddleja alternifolia TaxID=168488 RepID=A0AAV6XFA9_9LAMI|nr:hypothetical protein BUALT_Bualt07G0152700 [Buddleja alternifolia]
MWKKRSKMAHAAVVSILQILDQITKHDQYSNFFTSKQQFESLHENFSFLQAFLENDPRKGEETTDSLEKMIRETAYQAQDIIECHVSYQVSSEQECKVAPVTVNNSPWRLLSAVQKVVALRKRRESKNDIDPSVHRLEKVYEDLQKVVEQADLIVKEVTKIKKSRKNGDLQFRSSTSHLGSPRPGGKTEMVGFDEDLGEMKDQLCGGSSKLQVISLVGMGGIGKTTLANNLFDDPLIVYHFHVRAWTTITQNYHVREILLGLVNSLPHDKSCRETEEGLAEFLYKSLKGRKYLVVLDDMWSTEAWDEVKMLFPDDNNGSRIMLTTRLFDFYANPFGPLQHLQFLDEDESWNLLRMKVFAGKRCPPELEEIGKLIAKNCRGLPLAIVVVAGLLRKSNWRKSHWENIAWDVSLSVARNDVHFSSSILSLSYNHLPHHLKACFLYIGGFPEDYEIPVFKLINVWIAEGFLKPIGSKSSEVAEEYLEDLVKRSLVLVTKKSSNGKFKFCSIHDLLRDLCILKAREEDFLNVLDGIQETITNKRRLSFSRSLEWFYFKNLDTTNSPVRSIFCCLYNVKVTGFSLLRVLDVLEVIAESFPVEILQLFHLRYLAFTSGFVRYCTLPPLITKLQSLQTLIIGSSVAFRTSDHMLFAPLPIWKMPQLRHLIFLNIILSPVPLTPDSEFRVLENLQTLSRVKNFRFTKKAIEMIPNLKKLKVFYTSGSHIQRTEYELKNLVHLHQLKTLNLKFHPSSDWWRDPLPIGFGLPIKLKKLTLCGSRLLWKDMTIVGSLPNLEVLKLLSLSVMGREWDSVEGEFIKLKFLLLEWLDLKCWRAENTHFPRLERLVIRHCAVLEEIPCGIGEIATLEMIEVNDSKSAADSAKVILEEQQDLGNDVLQVHVGSHLVHNF